MARVPEAEIERLKREISLERLVAARGIVLAKTGANLVGLCPFHDDKNTPNLVITPEKNVFHCFACDASGSVIDWVMKTEGLSFRHAVEVLRGGGELGASAGPPPKLGTVRKLSPVVQPSADRAELLGQVVDFYHATLKESPEALAYLESRGLKHPEMVERFKLGYANRTLAYRLPQRNRKAGAELRGELMEIGVLRQASGHEHLRGSLVVPLFDEGGRVVQLYGRKIRDDLRGGTPSHLYLPGTHFGIFNREALATSDEVIVCESLIDALTFWCAGFRNVTSAYGVEGVTDELVTALVACGARVKIAFDRDDAGERGAEKLAARLLALGVETYQVMFPKGMDANDYAQKVLPADRSLGLAVRQARWMGKGAAPAHSVEPQRATSSHEEQRAAKGEKSEETAPDRPLLAASLALPAASPEANVASVATVVGDDLIFQFGDRRWRARPVGKPSTAGELRVNLFVSRERGGFFVDTPDLYAAKRRGEFVKAAAAELEVEEKVVALDLGRILLELEARRDREREAAEAPAPAGPTISDVEREEALELLRDPKLLERITDDIGRVGLVGERENKLVAYLAATSRKLEEPLAVVIQSSSAAGKSSLMDAVLSLMPEEERVQYSAMTGQSLFYMSGQDLKHKVLAIVEEEGAERASYALKLLQSEGELTIASTGKDPATGRLVTHTYRVEGPVSIMLTTTAIEVDEELLNRCLVLTVDEGREQTRAIHERQRRSRTIEGRVEREERTRIRSVHRNAQRLLKPLFVANPYAPELQFADHVTRTRRDHMKYLTLISAVALLHQYQRPVKSIEHRGQRIEYIEATRADVAMATKLAHAVMGRSLDELPPQTRRMLAQVSAMVARRMAEEGVDRRLVRFSRREVREWSGLSQTQVKLHMQRLEELEYLLPYRTRGPLVMYELAYADGGEDGDRSALGLGEHDSMGTTRSSSGPARALSGSDKAMTGAERAIDGPSAGPDRGQVHAANGVRKATNGAAAHRVPEVALQGSVSGIRS
jgi:DNA primase